MSTELNQPLFLFLAAKEYFENGTHYASKFFRLKEGKLITPFDGATHAKLCVPATNISFGTELSFKALLMLKGIRRKSHDLSILFNALDKATKESIINHYINHDHYKSYISIRLTYHSTAPHGSYQFLNLNTKSKEFIFLMLESHKLAFEKYRYLYEYDGKSEWWFHFREFSNFSFSVLFILGEKLGHKVVLTKTKVSKE